MVVRGTTESSEEANITPHSPVGGKGCGATLELRDDLRETEATSAAAVMTSGTFPVASAEARVSGSTETPGGAAAGTERPKSASNMPSSAMEVGSGEYIADLWGIIAGADDEITGDSHLSSLGNDFSFASLALRRRKKTQATQKIHTTRHAMPRTEPIITTAPLLNTNDEEIADDCPTMQADELVHRCEDTFSDGTSILVEGVDERLLERVEEFVDDRERDCVTEIDGEGEFICDELFNCEEVNICDAVTVIELEAVIE